jgi:general secretion pathway protein J
MPPPQVSRDGGFTLIEMLVALTLLTLAAGLMFEGLGSGQRLWAGEAARTARGESVEAAQATLRARLEQLRPATRYAGAAIFVDIDGSDRRLAFIAPPADAQRPAAARRYQLILNEAGELVLSSAPGQVDAADGADYTDQVLLRDVGGLDISYYGPDASGGAAQWRSDWSQRATPPQLVKVALAFRPGDRRVWPELIVHPAAVVDTLCSLDETTGSCRGRE